MLLCSDDWGVAGISQRFADMFGVADLAPFRQMSAAYFLRHKLSILLEPALFARVSHSPQHHQLSDCSMTLAHRPSVVRAYYTVSI